MKEGDRSELLDPWFRKEVEDYARKQQQKKVSDCQNAT